MAATTNSSNSGFSSNNWIIISLPLNPWPCAQHLGWNLPGKSLEVLGEHSSEFASLGIVSRRIGPGSSRVKNLGWYVGASCRDGYPKGRIRDGWNVGQRTIKGCMDHCPGISNLHSLPYPVRPPTPASVHKPDIDLVLGDLLPQQIGIDYGGEGHKGRPKTGAEGRLGFGHPF